VPTAVAAIALVCLTALAGLPTPLAFVAVWVIMTCMFTVIYVFGMRLDRRRVNVRDTLRCVIWCAVMAVLLAGFGAVMAGL
jgi:hypothetical protein